MNTNQNEFVITGFDHVNNGIFDIEKLQIGDHLCCLYNTDEELRKVVVPFLKSGVEKHNKIIYLTDTYSSEQIRNNLSAEGVAINSYINTGQFRFLTAEVSYLQDETFNPDSMITLLKDETARAVAEGYSALQVTGVTSWIIHNSISPQKLIEYETKLNDFFSESPCIGICQYDLRVFPPDIILNLLRTHPKCIIQTQVYRNTYYIPVKDMLSINRDAVELQNWINNLRNHRAEADELQKSKALYKAAFNQSSAIKLLIDPQTGEIVDVNKAAERFYGYNVEKFKTMNINEINTLAPQQVQEEMTRARVQERLHFNFRHRLASGKIHDVEVYSGPIIMDGRTLLQSTVHDITEQKQAEEALRESEARFRLALKNSSIVVFSQDKQLRYTWIHNPNPDFMRETVLGKTDAELLPAKEAARLTEIKHRVLVSGIVAREQVCIATDMNTNFYDLTVEPLRSGSGCITGVTCVAVNITPRIQIEEALRESEQRFRTVADNAYNWEYWQRPDNSLEYVSPSVKRITGYDAQEFIADSKLTIRIIHPEDLELFIAHMKFQHVQDTEELRFRIITKTNEIKWIHHICRAIRDEQGLYLGKRASNRDVTDHKRAEDALKEKTRELEMERNLGQTYLDIAAVMILIFDKYGRITLANKKAHDLLGYKDGELIGKNWFDTCIPEVIGVELKDSFSNMISGKSVFSEFFENPVKTKNGNQRIISWHNSAHRDNRGIITSIISSGEDITDRKQMEYALRESEERFRQIAENVHEAFFLFDIHSESILYINPAIEKSFGIPISLLKEKKGSLYLLYEIVIEEDRHRLGMESGWLARNNRIDVEFRIRQPDNKLSWIRLRTFPVLDSTGDVYRVAGLIADITTQKEMKERECEHQQQLQQADKMVTLGQIVSGVAHEINNPNNFIMLNAPLVRKAWESILPVLLSEDNKSEQIYVGKMRLEDFTEYMFPLVDGILEGSKRISRIVTDLKDYTRPDIYDLTRKIDFTHPIRSAINLMRNTLTKNNINFVSSISDTPVLIQGSSQRLEQVVINLLQNSCDALTPNGARSILLSLDNDRKDDVSLSICDSGCGIEPQDLPHITEPFFTTKRSCGGTGLGLSVSSKIVADHGGRLLFTSKTGSGTTVTLQLPRRQI